MYLANPVSENLEQTRSLIDCMLSNNASGTGINLAVRRLDHPEKMLGYAGIWKIAPHDRSGELGFVLAPEIWGEGLMGDALDALLAWNDREKLLPSIVAKVHQRNAASIHLLIQREFVRTSPADQANFDWYRRRSFVEQNKEE